jgi:hypothetical protein
MTGKTKIILDFLLKKTNVKSQTFQCKTAKNKLLVFWYCGSCCSLKKIIL